MKFERHCWIFPALRHIRLLDPKLLPLRRLVGESRIAEPGANGQYTPMLDVAHERHLAQSLHHGIIVHDHGGLMPVDARDCLANALRQVETPAFPISRQVLAAALDRAVFANKTRTADSDEGRHAHLVLRRSVQEALEHVDEPLDRLVAFGLVIRMTPDLQLPDTAFGEIRRLSQSELDDARTNIRAADIRRQDGVVPGEYPSRRQVSGPDEAGLVGMKADRDEVDIGAIRLQQHGGSTDGDLADAAVAEPAADHDTLCAAPCLEAKKPLGDGCEFLGKILYRSVHDTGRFHVAGGQELVKLLLPDPVARLVSQRILVVAPAPAFALIVENRLKGALARAVADETVAFPQFFVVGIDYNGRQLASAMRGERRRRFVL